MVQTLHFPISKINHERFFLCNDWIQFISIAIAIGVNDQLSLDLMMKELLVSIRRGNTT